MRVWGAGYTNTLCCSLSNALAPSVPSHFCKPEQQCLSCAFKATNGLQTKHNELVQFYWWGGLRGKETCSPCKTTENGDVLQVVFQCSSPETLHYFTSGCSGNGSQLEMLKQMFQHVYRHLWLSEYATANSALIIHGGLQKVPRLYNGRISSNKLCVCVRSGKSPSFAKMAVSHATPKIQSNSRWHIHMITVPMALVAACPCPSSHPIVSPTPVDQIPGNTVVSSG